MQNPNCLISNTCCTLMDFANRFVQRWDVHAYQTSDGRYICVHEPLHLDHIFAHLMGEITLGIYLLNQNSEARFVVLDADDKQGFKRLCSLAKTIAQENALSYIEKSRRGAHLWLFLNEPVSGTDARYFALGLLNTHKQDNLEVFPKQDMLSGGPGSLIRMPLGLHRLTGQRYDFYDIHGEKLATTPIEQIYALSAAQSIPKEFFEKYRTSGLQAKEFALSQLDDTNDLVSERIKAKVSVYDFVRQYVDLKPVSGGALGLCPFHDDHHPSFGVNTRDNYWHCFAGCGGGSVINFWMKWQRCDFKTAVIELAQMLL